MSPGLVMVAPEWSSNVSFKGFMKKTKESPLMSTLFGMDMVCCCHVSQNMDEQKM